jgi:endonuclease/exonuclease/phosphatase family metal-dependent hydrolase
MSRLKTIALIIVGFVLLVLLLAGAGILWLNANEYKPADLEAVAVSPELTLRPARSQPIEIISWNIGYASLDAKEDFFMDGGKKTRPDTAGSVVENMRAIRDFISAANPDIFFLQEIDVNSKRSYGNDQVRYLSENWKGSSAFALNFKCPFVPIPIPQFIGKVESGILTLNSYGGAAERISLPSPFAWPERVAQLKRCLLVTRVPLQGDGVSGNAPELVLVNLHLEAYDTGGAGRQAQTKLLAQFLLDEYAKGNYCVAGGDFNQVFPAVKDVFPVEANEYFTPGVVDDSLFGEGWILAADPTSPTCRSLDKPYDGNRVEHQFYLIDGFILSPNVELISVQTVDLDFKNSDHNPVKLTFRLR